VPGRNYELLSSRSMDINDAGGYVFKANLDGSTSDDDVIIRNGSVLVREGGTLPDIAPFVITSIGTGSGPVRIGDNGWVLWYGEWDDPNTDVNSGLFVDSTLIVQEGSEIGLSDVIDAIVSGQDGFSMSAKGYWCIFEATLVGGDNVAILRDLQTGTAVADAEDSSPVVAFALRAAPNPFNPTTSIRYETPAAATVTLSIHDVAGRLVIELVRGPVPRGAHTVTWDGRGTDGRPAPSGVYFARLGADDFAVTHKLVLLR
jgi:hypothetical protein